MENLPFKFCILSPEKGSFEYTIFCSHVQDSHESYSKWAVFGARSTNTSRRHFFISKLSALLQRLEKAPSNQRRNYCESQPVGVQLRPSVHQLISVFCMSLRWSTQHNDVMNNSHCKLDTKHEITLSAVACCLKEAKGRLMGNSVHLVWQRHIPCTWESKAFCLPAFYKSMWWNTEAVGGVFRGCLWRARVKKVRRRAVRG